MMAYMDSGFKKFTSFHDRLTLELGRCFEEINICLPIMWKIITAPIRKEIYFSLVSHGPFSEEQKRCYKEIRGTGDLLKH